MRYMLIIVLTLFVSRVEAQANGHSNVLHERIIPAFMAVDGVALVVMWTVDIHNKKLLKEGFFHAQEDGRLFWPHLIAEYSTALGLVVGAYGLYTEAPWARPVAFASLGALSYTSMSSLGWAFARQERVVYAIPMLISLAGAGLSIMVIF